MNLKINNTVGLLYAIFLVLIFATTLFAPSRAFAATSQIRITEIMYDPSGNGDREFLEIYNGSDTTTNLGGMTLFGVDYTFPGGTTLGAGQYGVIVRNLSVFKANNPGARIFGQYGGKLRGGGELVSISKGGVTQTKVSYSYGGAWPSSPKDGGPSLSLVKIDGNESLAGCWAASSTNGGTPSRSNNPASGGSGCTSVAYQSVSQSTPTQSDVTTQNSDNLSNNNEANNEEKTEEQLLEEQAAQEVATADEASQQIADESAAKRQQTRTNIFIALSMIFASILGALLFNIYRRVKIKIYHKKLIGDNKDTHAKHKQKS